MQAFARRGLRPARICETQYPFALHRVLIALPPPFLPIPLSFRPLSSLSRPPHLPPAPLLPSLALSMPMKKRNIPKDIPFPICDLFVKCLISIMQISELVPNCENRSDEHPNIAVNTRFCGEQRHIVAKFRTKKWKNRILQAVKHLFRQL